MTVIVLVLALAVPGLSAMNAQARMTSAVQTVNGMMTRAYYLSVADTAMTAVRFLPAEWDVVDPTKQVAAGAQRVAVYKYVGSADRENSSGGFDVKYEEYFQRAEDIGSAELPADIWVAPLEALSQQPVTLNGTHQYPNFGQDFVLDGWIQDRTRRNEHHFALDANRDAHADSLLNADDFLVVFDPQMGLRGGVPEAHQLRAFDPRLRAVAATGETETAGARDGSGNVIEPYRRYNFTGVVIYRRENFLTLGSEASGEDRQNMLIQTGRPYLAQRFGGGLLSGAPGQ